MNVDPNCATVNRGATCDGCSVYCGAGQLLDDRQAAGALAYVLWRGYTSADITRALMSEERRDRAGEIPFPILARESAADAVPAPSAEMIASDSLSSSRGVIISLTEDGTEVKVAAVGVTRDEAADLLESVLEDFEIDDAVSGILSERRTEAGA